MYQEITTIEEALKRSKDQIDLQKTKDALTHLPGKFLRGVMALISLQIIVHAVNNDDPSVEEWKADYNNGDQYKWFPWYQGGAADASGSGVSFHATNYGWTNTTTTTAGGARLALKDEERAIHMNKYFQDLYKDLYLILE